MSKNLNRSTVSLKEMPVKILQFGEGNFLRAFADWCVDIMNTKIGYNAGVAVVQPIEHGLVKMLDDQDGLYHHLIRGLANGEAYNETRLISCIQESINPFENAEAYFSQAANAELKVIISNTTEAGIRFDKMDLPAEGELAITFPGKLTQLLKKRFDHFSGSSDAGLSFIPCELIENNGTNLKQAIKQYAELWNLGSDFVSWIDANNYFANTLVDRIVPGYPKDEIEEIRSKIGYNDQLVVSSEVFHLWVIQGTEEIQKTFPADTAGLNVKFVNDITPYRTRKVRILNGAHTCMVPIALLAGIETVRESVEHDLIGPFILSTLDEEISPTIDLPEDELKAFSAEVIERFRNPFIRHELKSISLNSISKFKVRVLPSLKDAYQVKAALPERLVFSLACLIKLYLSDGFDINDDESIKDYFEGAKSKALTPDLVEDILGRADFWGEELTQTPGLADRVTNFLNQLGQKSSVDIIKEIF
ncbi:MAG: tagaturonate reductase [Cyclobacteriaceae bacterium]